MLPAVCSIIAYLAYLYETAIATWAYSSHLGVGDKARKHRQELDIGYIIYVNMRVMGASWHSALTVHIVTSLASGSDTRSLAYTL